MLIRKAVIDSIRPLLPKGWRLYDHNRSLDDITAPVVMLHIEAITRTPQAPQGHRTVTYLLTVIEPLYEPGRADDALDEKLIELVDALDTVPKLRWMDAKRVTFQDTRPAYDITLEVLTVKE